MAEKLFYYLLTLNLAGGFVLVYNGDSDRASQQAHASQRELKLFVHAGAGMLKAESFGFDAVHQNNSYPGKRIVIELTCGDANQIAPIKALLVQRNAFFFFQI
jgi:hypothetical protein